MEPRISPQIVTVALNPALDQTVELEALRPGEVNRAQRMQIDVGGKGINVASCLADFGIRAAVVGLLGRENATPFEELFRNKHLGSHCITLGGATRVNTHIVDRLSAEMQKAVNTPSVRARLLELGLEPVPSDPANMAKRWREDVNVWPKLIRERNISLD